MTGANISAGSVSVLALADDVQRASAKSAVNALTGLVAALLTGSTVNSSGPVVVGAADRSVLEATSDGTAITPGTALVTLAVTRADNRLDRPVSAEIRDSTVTTTGDVSVLAATAPTLRSRVDTTIVQASSAPLITGAAAITGTISLNSLSGGARASITDSAVTAHDVVVRADSSGAIVDAVSQLSATSAAGGGTLSGFGAGLSIGASIAVNFIGYSIASLALGVVEVLIDAQVSGTTPDALDVVAAIRDSVVAAGGDVTVEALADPLVNATVSNAAQTTSASIFGSASAAAGAVVASNKVLSRARATVEAVADHLASESSATLTHGQLVRIGVGRSMRYLGTDQSGVDLRTVTFTGPNWAPASTLQAAGDLLVQATSAAGVFANVKVVSSSVTTSDGGSHLVIGESQYAAVAADHTTSDAAPGTATAIAFRDRVRIADGFGTGTKVAGTEGTQLTALTTNTVVALDAAYGTGRLTSASGIRLLRLGDVVTVSEGHQRPGIVGATYRYVGPSTRADLGSQNYTDASRWALVGGAPGAVYRYTGSTVPSIDLNSTDYGDSALWQLIGGEVGTVYEYLGPVSAGSGTIALDLRTQNYGDLGTWRPVPVTSVLPEGFNITQSPSVAIGAVIVLNDVDNEAVASVNGMLVTADDVVVRAVQSGLIRADVDLTASSSGGSSITGEGRSLAAGGIIATNRVLGSATATVVDSDVTANGDLSVLASNTSVIEARNAAMISSGAQSVSIVLAFNTVGLKPTNLFFAAVDALVGGTLISDAYDSVAPVGAIAALIDSRTDVGGDVVVDATSQAQVRSQVTNNSTSAPAAIFGAGGISIAGVLSSNRIETVVSSSVKHGVAPGDRTTSQSGTLATGDRVRLDANTVYEFTAAPRGPPAQSLSDSVQNYAGSGDWRLVSTLDAGGSVTVTSSDRSQIVAETSIYGAVSKTNDAGAGIINNWAGTVLDDYRFTSRSGTQRVDFGDLVRVADDYGTDASGKVFRYMGVAGGPGTGIDLGTQDYGDFELWKELSPSVLISSTVGYVVLAAASKVTGKALAGSAEGYYAVLTFSLLSSSSTATIVGTTVHAEGDVSVAAEEAADLWATDDSSMVVSSTGGLVTTNVLLATAAATVTDATITSVLGDVVVSAANTATLTAHAVSTISSLEGKSVVLAFNSVGWRPSNVLFNLAEAVLGSTPISEAFGGESPALATAAVTGSVLVAGGEIRVAALDGVQVDALAGNENIAGAGDSIFFDRPGAPTPSGTPKVGGFGKPGLSVGGVVASNKVSSGAVATFTGGSATAGGDVTVEATDRSAIISHSVVVQSATSASTLGALLDAVNTLLFPAGYAFTTASGTRTLVKGDRVRLGALYAGGGTGGGIYEYTGLIALTTNLGATNFGAGAWLEIDPATDVSGLEKILPGVTAFGDLNVLPSSARAIGVLIVYNDVRSTSTATVSDTAVTASGAITVRAVLDAELVADLLTNVNASGGSFYGTGDVLAVNVIVATNLVLADAVASVLRSALEGASVTVEAVMSSGLDATVMATTTTGEEAGAFVLAFNSIGWRSQNILFNAIDALLGDPLLSAAFDGEDVAEAKASVTASTVTSDGEVTVRADNATRLNSTVSNAADSAAGALFDAKGKSFGGILVSNKVSSAATATVSDSTVTAGGAVLVVAVDDTSIFSNTKIVISSTTTNNGGANIINSAVGSRTVTPDWMSGQGTKVLQFGDLVQLAADFGSPVATAGVDGVQDVALVTGDAVEVGDGYGTSRLTTGSGIRLLTLGDVVTVEDGYLPGGDGGRAYRYLGPNARLDLSAQDYRVAATWAPVSGTAGSVYRYLGADATLDLNSTDYGDTALWDELGGAAGTTYEFMGPDSTSVNLGTGAPDGVSTNYTDLGWWKPVPEATPLPTNWNVTSSDSMGLGGAVVLNDLRNTVTASITASTVAGTSVGVLARGQGLVRATVDSTSSSSGGSSFNGQGDSMAVAASIATNRIITHLAGTVTDSTLRATAGDIGVDAANLAQVDAITNAAAVSGADAFGVVLAFTTIGWKATNLFFAALDSLIGGPVIGEAFDGIDTANTDALVTRSSLTASGSVLVSAVNAAIVFSEVGNDATSAPAAMFGAAGKSVGAVVASTKVASAATAAVDGSTVTATSGTVTVTASDEADVESSTAMSSDIAPSNDGGAGLLNQWAGDTLDDYDFTSNSGPALVGFGTRVRVADDYADADTAGKVYQYMGLDTLTVVDLTTADYADFELWKELTPTTLITESLSYALLGTAGLFFDVDGTTGGASSYYGLVDLNDVRSAVTARVTGSTVRAGADVVVSATDAASITAFDDSVVSAFDAKGVVLVTNLVLAAADTLVTDSSVTAGRDISVTAVMAALLDATASSSTETWDSKTAIIAFNSIGWNTSNFLFNALEAILGDPLLSDEVFDGLDPARAHAIVTDSPLVAGRDILVSATSRSELVAVSSNDNTIDAVVDIVFPGASQEADYDKKKKPEGKKANGYGASGAGGGFIIASNKVNSEAIATIVFTGTPRGEVTAGGDVTVSAADDATIDAHSTVVQDVNTVNSVSGLVDIANSILIPGNYDYTTASGTRLIESGDKVRLGATYAGGGQAGSVYEYSGAGGPLDLGTQVYDAAHGWTKLLADAGSVDDLFPGLSAFAGLNFTASKARAVGILVLYNDLRSEVHATIDHAVVTASGGTVTVSALQNALMKVHALVNVSAFGGSSVGTGSEEGTDVYAYTGQLVTNVVLAHTTALLDDSRVTAAALAVEAASTSGIDARVETDGASGEDTKAVTIAFNTVGWKTQNLLFNIVDAVLGDPLLADAFDGMDAASTSAKLWDTTVVLTGGLRVVADNSAQLNATVSNAATSAASALFGASGSAGGGLLASNKVASSATALVGFTNRDTSRATREISAGGAIVVSATDNAGIYANIKLVSSSTTANDGGASILQQTITGLLPADFLSSEGEVRLLFGSTVKIADGYIENDWSTGDGEVTLTTGQKVAVDAGYTDARFTNESGRRLVLSGEVVDVDGTLYRYTGPNARLDLGTVTYDEAHGFFVIGGEDDAIYEYLGADDELDLGVQDYTDTLLWRKLAGTPGDVYTYLGDDNSGAGVLIDLGTQDYGNLGYWKPNLLASVVPTGINIDESDSQAVGAVVVLNDVRSTTHASIENADLTGSSVSVMARGTAVIRALTDVDVSSSGGQSWGGEGDSLAVGAVIATNVITSSVLAEVRNSDLRALSGHVVVTADGLTQVDAQTLASIQSEGDTYGVVLAFNTIGWKSQNFLFNTVDTILGDPLVNEAFDGSSPSEIIARLVDTTVDAAGDVKVTANNEGTLQAQVSNTASSVVVTFTKAEAFALGILIASNMVNLTTRAEVLFGSIATTYATTDTPSTLQPGDRVAAGPGAIYEYTGAPRGPPVNLTDATQHYATNSSWTRVPNLVQAGGSVLVTAEESAEIDAESTVEVTATADSTAGMNLVLDLLTNLSEDYQFTNRSGTRLVTKGQAVRLDSAVGGGTAGSVYVYRGADNAGAGALVNLGTAIYNGPDWSKVILGDTLDLLNSIGISTTGILGADATGVGGMFVRNDARGDVAATIGNATVSAGAAVLVSALETATIHADTTGTVTVGGGGYVNEGSSTAVNFVVASNVVLSGAVATVVNSDLDAGTSSVDTVTVTASNTSVLTATTETSTTSAGTSVGVTIAINTVGIDSQNILFNIVEAIVGDVIDTEEKKPARTEARVTGSSLDAGGAISVTASSAAAINATVSASTVAFSSSLTEDSDSISVGVVVAMNRLSTKVQAILENAPTVHAGGTFTVSAKDDVAIKADVSAPSISVAISLKESSSVGVALSIARNDIQTETDAKVTAAPSVTAGGAASVTASESSTIDATSTASSVSVAVSLKGSVAFAGGGATAVNLIKGNTNATVTGSSIVSGSTVKVSATNSSEIHALIAAIAVAVSAAVSGSTPGVAIGFSLARNLIGWEEYGGVSPIEVKARAISSHLQGGADVVVSASSSAVITAIVSATSVAVAASTDSAIAVSIGGLWTDNKIGSRIEASTTQTSVTTANAGAFRVTASDTSRITADARAAAVSASLSGGRGGSGAVGLSLAHNTIDTQVVAMVFQPGTVIAPGGVLITATNSSEILVQSIAVAVSVAVAGGNPALALAGGGAESTNLIVTTTRAGVSGGSLGTAAAPVKDVTVKAESTGTIEAKVIAVAASIAFGTGTSVGLALGVSVARNIIGSHDTPAVAGHTSTETAATLSTGDYVRIFGGSQDGWLYRYRGPPVASINLATTSYTNRALWRPVFTTGDRPVTLQAGDLVVITSGPRIGDVYEYAGPTLTAPTPYQYNSTQTLTTGLATGATVRRTDDDAIFRYLGPALSGTVDLSTQELTDTDLWEPVPIGGSYYDFRSTDTATNGIITGTRVKLTSTGRVYRYLGPNLTGSVALSGQSYGTATLWELVPDGVELSRMDYSDSSVWTRADLTPDRSSVEAVVLGASVFSVGDVSVTAKSTQSIDALVVAAAVGVSGGGTAGIGLSGAGVYTENRITSGTRAVIDGGDASTPVTIRALSLEVKADDVSMIRVVAAAASVAAGVGGTAGVAVSIGLSIALNSLDIDVAAAVIAATVTTTTGDVVIEATSRGSELFDLPTSGLGTDPAATLDDAAQGADDDPDTAADEEAVDAAADAAVLKAIEQKFKAQGFALTAGEHSTTDTVHPAFTSQSGTVDLKPGDAVRVVAGAAGGTLGTVYVYIGPAAASVNLATVNFATNPLWKTGLWVTVKQGEVVRNAATGLSYRYKGANALLDLGAQTYTSTATWEYLPPALTIVKAGEVWQLTSGTDVYLITKVAVTGYPTRYVVSRPTIGAVAVAASLAVAIGGTVGVAVAGAGAYARNEISGSTNAWAENSSIDSAGDVTVTAAASSSVVATIVAASASIAIGGTAGVGVSIGIAIAENSIGGYSSSGRAPVEVRAYLLNTSVDAATDLTLSATTRQKISAIVIAASAAVAVGGTVGVAVSGAGAISFNRIVVDVAATITGDAPSGQTLRGITAGSTKLTASDESSIRALTLGASLAAGFGYVGVAVSIAVSLAQNTIDNAVTAAIRSVSEGVTTGDLEVRASSTSSIDSLAIAASIAIGGGFVGVGISGAGAVALNVILTHTVAEVADSDVTATKPGAADGSVKVTASDSSTIRAVVAAASAAVSGGFVGVSASIGLSIARNLIGYSLSGLDAVYSPAEIRASILRSTVDSDGDVTVMATSSSTIDALVLAISVALAGGAVAGSVTGAGTSTENRIATIVHASVAGDPAAPGSSSLTAATLEVSATDSSHIRAIVAAASVAVAAGLGAITISVAVALARNDVANDVAAFIADTGSIDVGSLSVDATTSGGDPLSVTSTTLGSLLTTAAHQISDVDATVPSGEKAGTVHSGTLASLKTALPALHLSDTLAVSILVDGSEWVLRDVATGRSWIVRKTLSGYSLAVPTIDAVSVAASVALAAGAVSVSVSGAGALATNIVTSRTRAHIDDSDVTSRRVLATDGTVLSEGTVDVTALSSSAILSTIVGASLALGAGLGGLAVSVGVAISRNLVGFTDGNGTAVDHTTGVPLSASNAVVTGDLVRVTEGSLTGRVFQYVGSTSLGSWTDADGNGTDFTNEDVWRPVTTRNPSQVAAYLDGSSATAGGATTIEAISGQTIASFVLAASAALAAGVVGLGGAGAGASAQNRIAVDVAAYVTGAGASIDLVSAPSLRVTASDSATIISDVGAAAIAAAVGLIAGSVAIAVALAQNVIDSDVAAYLSAVGVTAGTVKVEASETATIQTITVAAAVAVAAGAISVALAGAGAIAENLILGSVRGFADSSTISATGAVWITAENTATITATIAALAASVSGSVLGGGAAAIGAAIARNILGMDYALTSGSGTVTVRNGDVVKLAPTYSAGGVGGAMYEYTGTRASLNLGTQNYGSPSGPWVLHDPNEVLAYLHDTSVAAAGALTVEASDTSTITALVAAGSVAVAASFGFSLTGAGAGAQSTNRIGTRVHAWIDGDGATGVRATSITVKATSTTSIGATTGAVAVALSIAPVGVAIAVAEARATNTVDTDTAAFITGADNGVRATSGGVSVEAVTQSPQLFTVAGGAPSQAALNAGAATTLGTLRTLFASESEPLSATSLLDLTTITPDAVWSLTDIATGRGYLLTWAAGTLRVSRTTINAYTISAAVSGGLGAFSAAGSRSTNTTTSGTRASIGSGNTTAFGDVTVRATDTSSIVAVLPTISLSGGLVAAAGATSFTENTIGSIVQAYVDGGVTSTDGGVSVIARTDATAHAETLTVAVAIGFGGASAKVDAITTVGGRTEARLDGGARVTAPSGGVSVRSTSHTSASARMEGGSGAIGLALTSISGTATIQDALLAQVGDGAVVTAASLSVTVGDVAGTDPATRTVNAVLSGGSGGIVAATALKAVATISGSATSRIGRAVVTTTDASTVRTIIVQSASATTIAGGGGLAEITSTSATASIGTTTAGVVIAAIIDEGAVVTAGSLTINATGTATATTTVDSGGGGIVAVGAGSGSSFVDTDVQARLGPVGTATLPLAQRTRVTSTGTVRVAGVSSESATSTADRSGFGGITVSALTARADVTGSVSAVVGDSVAVTARNLEVASEVKGSTSRSSMTISSGGVVSIAKPTAVASSTSTATAGIGSNATIVAAAPADEAGGNVTVSATGRGEADSTAAMYSGGLVSGGGAKATSTVDPTVSVGVGSGTTITAGGDVTVTATLTRTPLAPPPSDAITAVDPANSTITVAFPLRDGDQVSYISSGTSTTQQIGGLQACTAGGDCRTYTVKVLTPATSTTPGTIAFESSFDLSAVDPDRDVITFDGPHNLRSGDAVYYRPGGGLALVEPWQTNPATCGSFCVDPSAVLYVRGVLLGTSITGDVTDPSQIDPTRIRLVTTRAAAIAAESTLLRGFTGVNGSTHYITFGGGYFTPGQVVTYRAAASLEFLTQNVDVALGQYDYCGLLDDTQLMPEPDCSTTPISTDHTGANDNGEIFAPGH
ncbi:MAG: hypothetical protein WBL35_02135, partial [Ornithinibacter sp.]